MKKSWDTTLWRCIGYLYEYFFRYWYRWKKRWFRMMFRIEGSASLQYLKCGKKLNFYVPVRVGAAQGRLDIDNDVRFGWRQAPMLGDGSILLEPRTSESAISIGEGTIFSNNVSIIAMNEIKIGCGCLIGDLTTIFDSDFHNLDPILRMSGPASVCSVTVGDNVWLGSRVQILRGVTIGDNSVIGAGSIVTHNIPANCVAAGIPAKVIREL